MAYIQIGEEIIEVDESEVAADEIAIAQNLQAKRDHRDTLLAETDWWAVSDRTMSDEERQYRQALRDITTHPNWPDVMPDDWPTKPE